VIQKDSNVNFLFSVPLTDLSLNRTDKTLNNNLLGQLVSRFAILNSKSNNMFNMSRIKNCENIMNAVDFAMKFQKSDKDQSYSTQQSQNHENLGSPLFDRVKPKKTNRLMHSKVEAFRKIEKTKFEDLRNLLGKTTILQSHLIFF